MSQIIFIYSNHRGVGKTSLNTAFALQEMYDSNLYENSMAEIDLLEQELARNFKRPTTQKHFIYSDYEIIANHRKGHGERTWPFNPFTFKLPTKRSSYSIFPPGSFFHINEAQTKYNSRKFKTFMQEVSSAYEASRHPGFTIVLDGLGLTSIDLKIRRLVDLFIMPLEVKHETYDGRIIRTVWHCRIFENLEDAEKYEVTGDSQLGEQKDYSFDWGNIYNCYKMRGNKLAFYRDAKDHDFEYLSWEEIDDNFMLPPKDYYEKGNNDD